MRPHCPPIWTAPRSPARLLHPPATGQSTCRRPAKVVDAEHPILPSFFWTVYKRVYVSCTKRTTARGYIGRCPFQLIRCKSLKTGQGKAFHGSLSLSVDEWGSGGPEFESRRPDQFPSHKLLRNKSLVRARAGGPDLESSALEVSPGALRCSEIQPERARWHVHLASSSHGQREFPPAV